MHIKIYSNVLRPTAKQSGAVWFFLNHEIKLESLSQSSQEPMLPAPCPSQVKLQKKSFLQPQTKQRYPEHWNASIQDCFEAKSQNHRSVSAEKEKDVVFAHGPKKQGGKQGQRGAPTLNTDMQGRKLKENMGGPEVSLF